MPTQIDISELANNMKNAASSVLHKDVSTLRGFSDRQIKAIAQQTELVVMGIASGQITEETENSFWIAWKTWCSTSPRRCAAY